MFLTHRSTMRRGLSYIEMTGVLLSVTAGVYIGAKYLGLDFNRVTYTALNEANLLGEIPLDWRPVNPDCPNGDCPSEEEIRAKKDAMLKSEFDTIRSSVALATGTDISSNEGMGTQQGEEQEQIQHKTKQYWQSLSGIMAEIEELDKRLDSELSLTSGDRLAAQKIKTLILRRQIYEYAQKAISNFDSNRVDPKVLSAGVRLSEWYAESATMMTKTIEMQEKSSLGDPALGDKQSFAQAQLQHQKQTELIHRWIAKTESHMDTVYGL